MARSVDSPSVSTWLTASGVPIRCWRPAPGEPQPLEWWEPFLIVCRRAREVHFIWPLWLDEFELIGRVDRARRPAIWVYRHRRARRELFCDDTGATYRLIATPRGRAPGQFRRCGLRTALFGAAIHAVVDPHWWKHPEDRRHDADSVGRPVWTVRPPRYGDADDDLDDAAADEERTLSSAAPAEVAPRFRLVPGGLADRSPSPDDTPSTHAADEDQPA